MKNTKWLKPTNLKQQVENYNVLFPTKHQSRITSLIIEDLIDRINLHGYYPLRAEIVDSDSLDNFLCDIDLCIGVSHRLGDHLGSTLLYQYRALFSHDISIDLGVDRRGKAITKFYDSEVNCKNVNDRLSGTFGSWSTNSAKELSHDDFEYLTLVSQEISKILLDCPTLAELPFEHGSGASSTIKNNTTAPAKLGSVLVCSGSAAKSMTELFDALPQLALFHNRKYRVGPGTLTTVPKTARIDRVILIEPVMNTFVQKGIGKVIRNRLSDVGIDLNDQGINQNLARKGSVSGDLATIDLSAASDNISKYLVLHLLPVKWFELLANWRTGLISDSHSRKFIELEKFSSMGNGYTFELESLIFYACSLVACRLSNSPTVNVSVYGDDIIIPVSAVSTLHKIFDRFGFTINLEKSYWYGSFRESCGCDYIKGINVRPFYKRDSWTPRSVARYLNHYFDRDHLISSHLREKLLNYVPFVPYGPPCCGDGHIWSDYTFVFTDEMLEYRCGSINASKIATSVRSSQFVSIVPINKRNNRTRIARQYWDRGLALFPAYSIDLSSDHKDTGVILGESKIVIDRKFLGKLSDKSLNYPSLSTIDYEIRRIRVFKP